MIYFEKCKYIFTPNSKLFYDEGHKRFVGLSKGCLEFGSRMGNFKLELNSLR
jgi:hypothetical protein